VAARLAFFINTASYPFSSDQIRTNIQGAVPPPSTASSPCESPLDNPRWSGFRWLERECAKNPRWTELIKSPRVSNIDQSPAPRSVQSMPSPTRHWQLSVTESSVTLPPQYRKAPCQNLSRFHQPIFLTPTGPAAQDATNHACCIRKLRRDRHDSNIARSIARSAVVLTR
jgi:hypothetical protein